MTLVKNIHACETAVQALRLKLDAVELLNLNNYCPNHRPLCLDTIDVPASTFLAVGDFRSHSPSWGYSHMDRRGEELETWQNDNQLVLINIPKNSPTLYSRQWHTTSTTGLALFAGGYPQRYQQRSWSLKTDPMNPHWNYKKANWGLFRHCISVLTKDIQVQGRDINHVVRDLNSSILKAAHEAILPGAHKDYKPYRSIQRRQLQDEMS